MVTNNNWLGFFLITFHDSETLNETCKLHLRYLSEVLYKSGKSEFEKRCGVTVTKNELTLNPAHADAAICCWVSMSCVGPIDPASSMSISFNNPLVNRHMSSFLMILT